MSRGWKSPKGTINVQLRPDHHPECQAMRGVAGFLGMTQWEYAAEAVKEKLNGVDPLALEWRANAIFEADRAHKEVLGQVILEARLMSMALHGQDLGKLPARWEQEHLDHASIPGFDVVSERLAERYPELFLGHDPGERLFWILTQADAVPISRDEAYQTAYDQLASSLPISA